MAEIFEKQLKYVPIDKINDIEILGLSYAAGNTCYSSNGIFYDSITKKPAGPVFTNYISFVDTNLKLMLPPEIHIGV